MPIEQRAEITVAGAEPLDDVVDRGAHIDVVQRQDVGDGVRRPSLGLAGDGVPRDEQLTEHVRGIRQQLEGAARRQ